MHSALFYRFTGGIDFILFPLAPDQARLLAGIFHYPVANTPGQAGRLTDLHSDPPFQHSKTMHKVQAISRTTRRVQRCSQAKRGWKAQVVSQDRSGVMETALVSSAPPVPSGQSLSPPIPSCRAPNLLPQLNRLEIRGSTETLSSTPPFLLWQILFLPYSYTSL